MEVFKFKLLMSAGGPAKPRTMLDNRLPGKSLQDRVVVNLVRKMA
jgi:hypothetical protein